MNAELAAADRLRPANRLDLWPWPPRVDDSKLAGAIADNQFIDVLADFRGGGAQGRNIEVAGGHAANDAHAIVDGMIQRRDPQADVAGRYGQVVPPRRVASRPAMLPTARNFERTPRRCSSPSR